MPIVPGYEIYASSTPAREVGGDFFDFISFDNGDLGLVIADVSGKSVPAALFMGLSCTAVRVCSRWVFSPSSLLGQVNSHIVRYAESGMFFSIFYALLKPGTGIVSYVNAGHPSPILIRDTEILELSRSGPIIGFMDDEEFFEKEITLQDGDLLVCYTDGVTEAKWSDGEMFGKERLIQTVKSSREGPVHEINDLILAEISRFAGDAPQFDDISLLIVKRTALS